jgi:hypothetical protein
MGLSYEPFLVYPCCIYCLTTEGEFTEEHRIPESLGNQGDQAIVLPKEYACKHCNNNILSPLDQELIDHPAIAFFRVHFVPYTKKGKRPKAGFQNISLYKKDEEHILMFIKDKSGLPRNLKKRSNNAIEYEMLVRGKRNFQPKLLGRALYKIGLGMLAFEYGQDRACRKLYDDARAFIKGERGFPNNLLIQLINEGEPGPNMQIYFRSDLPGTIYDINIYSLRCVINLEPFPLLLPPYNDPFASLIGAFLYDPDKPNYRWGFYSLNQAD